MSKILNGKIISDKIALRLTKKIRQFDDKPKLVIVQVGDLEESNTYIKHKKLFADKIGVLVEHKRYAENIITETIITDIKNYNTDSSVHGLIVQLPIPKHLDKSRILEAIDSKKDVDGMTAASTKLLFDCEKGFISGASKAILVLLDYEKINIAGKKVVVVGQSSLVGKPTALALLGRNATVTICHAKTKKLTEETKHAEILITAVGKPKFITEKFVSKGQIVIDIGITVIKNPKDKNKKTVVGDVDFEKVKNKVRAITPVPGGVGPMTVACLFENVVEAFTLAQKK